ncbi:hypothetical protein P0D69_30135 [Paraburkholderia sediminicola]|uniref:hypothetical protein n=1 Tax=Paraburkholderia sediminicola TaxID=458836 RepID=UPI0038BA24E6
MNAGFADRRRTDHSSDPTSSTYDTAPPALARRCGVARPLGNTRFALALGFTALLTLRMGDAHAQDLGMLDERVTQQSVGETICRPGYADTVAPPFDELMAHKDRMLAARGIDADNGAAFALDRRVPIVLGGSPDAPANLDLLPWAGHQGERRKARAAVMLKRCVCEGKLSLAEAQAAIVGNWSVVYSGFSQTSCDVSRLDVATGGDNGHGAGRDNPP